MAYGWNEAQTKLEPKGYLGGDNPARVYQIGDYTVTVPNDPEKPVTTVHRWRHSVEDPKKVMPNMEVRDDAIVIPITDLIATILSRLEPLNLAMALWENEDVRSEFVSRMALTWHDGSVTDSDRRRLLKQIQEQIHDKALDKAASAAAALEHKFGQKWWFYDEVNRINKWLRDQGYNDLRGDTIQLRHRDNDPEFKISGDGWEEARQFWRDEMRVKFFGPVEGPYQAVKCGCVYKTCKDWHVTGVANVQGVGFTEEQARAVAKLLNSMEPKEEPEQETPA